jgi:hypothetical protein
LSEPKTVAPAEVEDAFIKANPGLSSLRDRGDLRRTRLSEVRICMSKDLQFRACEEIDRRACRRDEVVMPPMRGGRLAGLARASILPGIPSIDCAGQARASRRGLLSRPMS